MERAITTASSLEAEQDSGNIDRTQSMATLNESFPQGTNSGSGPRCHDTNIRAFVKLKLESTPLFPYNGGLSFRRRYGCGLVAPSDSPFHKIYFHLHHLNSIEEVKMKTEEDVVLQCLSLMRRVESTPSMIHSQVVCWKGAEIEFENVMKITTASASVEIPDELTLAQTLIKIKTAKPQPVTIEEQVPASIKTFSSSQSQLLQVKDKGKGKMVEPKKLLKKKDQVALDEEMARNR
ncbi:hypothetical protein Tco_1295391 [Tanacetum coccineum]